MGNVRTGATDWDFPACKENICPSIEKVDFDVRSESSIRTSFAGPMPEQPARKNISIRIGGINEVLLNFTCKYSIK